MVLMTFGEWAIFSIIVLIVIAIFFIIAIKRNW